MTTLQLHASQLPIDGHVDRTIWRVEMNNNYLDFILINGKMTVEMQTALPWDDMDVEPEYITTSIPLSLAAELAVKYICGDFYNPNTNRFVGLFVAKR